MFWHEPRICYRCETETRNVHCPGCGRLLRYFQWGRWRRSVAGAFVFYALARMAGNFAPGAVDWLLLGAAVMAAGSFISLFAHCIARFWYAPAWAWLAATVACVGLCWWFAG